MIDGINAKLVPQATSFNTLCIQGLPANPNSNDILQGVINTLCSLSSVVSAFPTTYVKASDITSIVQQQITIYLSQSQTGQIEYFNYFPLGVGFPYFGSLASFDNTGKGLPSAGMTNLYLANGLNGTPDLRGRTLVGAVRNVPGGTLDVAVDPANVNNPNWALLDKNGENKHLNTVAETASHTHVVTDPGHTHDLTFKNMLPVKGGGNTAVPTLGSNPNFPITIPAAAISDTTGITIATTGGSQPHNNIQPSIACNWVIRMV
jgi:microcystin-dependent protein